MRLDDAGPRTRLLATITGWALLAWILALAGMGSEVATLADDPALLRPLPPLRPAPPARLGPLTQYADIAQRPLFSQDRRPKPFVLNGDNPAEAGATSFDYQLTSVLISPQASVAILQPAEGGEPVRVRLHEAPEPNPGWRLMQLNPRSAVFEGPEGQRTLELRVFDGQGGQPPTASTSGGDAARPPVAAPGTSVPIVPPPPSSGPARQAKPATASGNTPAPASDAAETPPASDQDQMEAIRRRIEARREQMRQQQQQQSPPVK